MTLARRLVVNADDLGLSPGVNRGVLGAHQAGIVTSASLMVRQPAAAAAAAAAREHPGLGLGLHLDFAEWELRDGEWRPVYEVVDPDDGAAVADEAERQLARFRELVGSDPTHLDSHQHVHRTGPARAVVANLARSLAVPFRHGGAVRFCGAFYGRGSAGLSLPDAIGPDALVSLIRGLPEGVTELCCHPAAELDIDSSYGAERRREFESLRDPRVRRAVEEAGVRLCSFRELASAVSPVRAERRLRTPRKQSTRDE